MERRSEARSKGASRGRRGGAALALVAMLFVAGSGPAHAISWVRGQGGIPNSGAVVDPLIQETPPDDLAASVSTGQFSDAQKGFFSQADLGNGTLKASAFVAGGSGAANANPVLGETITFDVGAGDPTSWFFEFAVEGFVETGDPGFPREQNIPGVGTFNTTFVQLAFHVFEGHTVGPVGGPDDWRDDLVDAIFTETVTIELPTDMDGNLTGLDEFVEATIDGEIDLDPGTNAFDVVAVLGVSGDIPSTFDSSFDLDFANTATLAIDGEFTSDSGVFLTGQNLQVPEPEAALLLLAAGLAGLARAHRQPRA